MCLCWSRHSWFAQQVRDVLHEVLARFWLGLGAESDAFSWPQHLPWIWEDLEKWVQKTTRTPFSLHWLTLVETNQQKEPFVIVIFNFFPRRTGPSSSKPCHGNRYRWTTSKTTLCPYVRCMWPNMDSEATWCCYIILHVGEFCYTDMLLRTAGNNLKKTEAVSMTRVPRWWFMCSSVLPWASLEFHFCTDG